MASCGRSLKDLMEFGFDIMNNMTGGNCDQFWSTTSPPVTGRPPTQGPPVTGRPPTQGPPTPCPGEARAAICLLELAGNLTAKENSTNIEWNRICRFHLISFKFFFCIESNNEMLTFKYIKHNHEII